MYIIGAASYPGYPDSYQFIFSDETMTHADESSLDPEKWAKHTMNPGTILDHIIIMYDKSDTRLLGIKFMSQSKRVLMKAGPIDLENYNKSSSVHLQTIRLYEHERILGIKSG